MSARRARMLWEQLRVEMLLTMRRGESLMVSFLVPIGVLIFFSEVDAVRTSYDDPVDFLVPGVLALAVMSTAMVSLGIATGYERRYGVLRRLGSTPLSTSGLLAAKTANVVVVEAIQAGVIVATGAALGWSVSSRVVPAFGALILGTIAFAGVGLLLAGVLRAEANLACANALFLAFLFLGGMAYPLHRLPDVLESIARALPAAALAETVRDVVVPGKGFPAGTFMTLLAWAVAAPVAAARWFRFEE